MTTATHLELPQIEMKICDIASQELGVRRSEMHPGLRLVQDLNCDSLQFVELIMAIEDEFAVTFPDDAPNPVYKAVFTRNPFRLGDLAELVYLQQGTDGPKQSSRQRYKFQSDAGPVSPFTQLNGRFSSVDASRPLFEPLGENAAGHALYRRATDGMQCVRVPAAEVVLGSADADVFPDERPRHVAKLDAFLIDSEPVSTTAYCRFLNSIGRLSEATQQEWFMPAANDRRREHLLIELTPNGWVPLAGTERLPMMLVSWLGANAYSLWANWLDWRSQSDSCLPSEAQWEYAARGAAARKFPWGDREPSDRDMRYARHQRGERYTVATLPLAPVNEESGLSPFGLRHMAGNVWQWCRDWYSPAFYQSPEASAVNPINRTPTGIRSERGGSWIGPAFLCRSSYRRGRVPTAKGRCLGFRCVSAAHAV
jgi:acyl carrier protein